MDIQMGALAKTVTTWIGAMAQILNMLGVFPKLLTAACKYNGTGTGYIATTTYFYACV